MPVWSVCEPSQADYSSGMCTSRGQRTHVKYYRVIHKPAFTICWNSANQKAPNRATKHTDCPAASDDTELLIVLCFARHKHTLTFSHIILCNHPYYHNFCQPTKTLSCLCVMLRKWKCLVIFTALKYCTKNHEGCRRTMPFFLFVLWYLCLVRCQRSEQRVKDFVAVATEMKSNI